MLWSVYGIPCYQTCWRDYNLCWHRWSSDQYAVKRNWFVIYLNGLHSHSQWQINFLLICFNSLFHMGNLRFHHHRHRPWHQIPQQHDKLQINRFGKRFFKSNFISLHQTFTNLLAINQFCWVTYFNTHTQPACESMARTHSLLATLLKSSSETVNLCLNLGLVDIFNSHFLHINQSKLFLVLNTSSDERNMTARLDIPNRSMD